MKVKIILADFGNGVHSAIMAFEALPVKGEIVFMPIRFLSDMWVESFAAENEENGPGFKARVAKIKAANSDEHIEFVVMDSPSHHYDNDSNSFIPHIELAASV